MEENKWKRADSINPMMGLDIGKCIDPQYWGIPRPICSSENDVEQRGYKRKKTSLDMIGTYVCDCLEKKDYK